MKPTNVCGLSRDSIRAYLVGSINSELLIMAVPCGFTDILLMAFDL